MTTINSTTPTQASATTSVSSALSSYSQLGEKDFLKLLTTELSNQDPTQPVDNKEMVAQLAQFSQLSSANTANTTLTGISDKLDAMVAAQQATNQTLSSLFDPAAATAAAPGTGPTA